MMIKLLSDPMAMNLENTQFLKLDSKDLEFYLTLNFLFIMKTTSKLIVGPCLLKENNQKVKIKIKPDDHDYIYITDFFEA